MEDFTTQSSLGTQAPLPVRDLYRSLQVQLEEHPYETLALAAGIGFILGGGLFSRLGTRVVGVALRAGLASAASPVLNALLQEVVHVDPNTPRPSRAQRPS